MSIPEPDIRRMLEDPTEIRRYIDARLVAEMNRLLAEFDAEEERRILEGDKLSLFGSHDTPS